MHTSSSEANSATDRLFNSIDDCNFDDFKKAIRDGANVNAFDTEGMTALMQVIMECSTVTNENSQLELVKIAKFLVKDGKIDINAQSKQKATVEMPGDVSDTQQNHIRSNTLRRDTALHIACSTGAVDMVQILLRHPKINVDQRNYENKTSKDCYERGHEILIKKEFEKATKGKKLLRLMMSNNINISIRKLFMDDCSINENLNPNCFSIDGKTPLIFIIESYLNHGTTTDKRSIFTNLLKHKDLDFSQVSVEIKDKVWENPEIKKILEKVLVERLTSAINTKDLDKVKELVEDNPFIEHAIVAQASSKANQPVSDGIKEYLDQKFAPSRGVKYEGAIEQELKMTTVQLQSAREFIEKQEKELRASQEQLYLQEQRENTRVGDITRNSDKHARKIRDQEIEVTILKQQLGTQKQQSDKKLVCTIRRVNTVSAYFISFAVCSVLAFTVPNPAMCTPVAIIAAVSLILGSHLLYKINNDIPSAKIDKSKEKSYLITHVARQI